MELVMPVILFGVAGLGFMAFAIWAPMSFTLF